MRKVSPRCRLPPLVERIEAFRHAVGRGRDLVRIDRIELLLFSQDFQIPENERRPANEAD
jgi:hypothetical protein